MHPNHTKAVYDVKEGLKKQPKVDRALKDISEKTGRAFLHDFGAKNKLILLFYFLGIIALALFKNSIISSAALSSLVAESNVPVNRIFNSLISILVILMLSRLIDGLVIQNISDSPMRYNLNRLLNLFMMILLTFIVISTIFINWYTAAISLGVISLILGFALQNPLVSFFAWVYILIRKPYEVGDRISIGDASGDVIDLNYFDTTLWEFGGKYISGDHPSGRTIRFPNSKIFNEYVYNYSWPLFPYLWNEIKFYVSYESDLEFIEKVVGKVVQDELGEEMLERVESYHALLEETPVEALKVKEKPAVFFRTSENTWVEVVVRYLVDPKKSGTVKSRLIKNILTQLCLKKDEIKFPSGNSR